MNWQTGRYHLDDCNGPILVILLLSWTGASDAAVDDYPMVGDEHCRKSEFVAATAGYDFTADLDRWGQQHRASNDDHQLKVVGEVIINRLPIFDVSNPREDNPIYRWMNRVHFDTRQKVIEDLLLFGVGDGVDSKALAESERVLREQNYIADAKIKTIADCGNAIDVEVITREVWTLLPEFSLKSSGGHSSSRIGVRDANFLGSGKQFSFVAKSNIDRDSLELHYGDRNLAGSRVHLRVHLVESSDGHRRMIRTGLPFYSLDSRRTWLVSMQQEDRVDSQYRLGKKVSAVSVVTRSFESSAGFSKGLQNSLTRRFSAGVHWEETIFAKSPDDPDPVDFPDDVRFAYPFLQYESIEDNYIVAFNIDQIHRAEDLHIGRLFNSRIGYSTWQTNQFVFQGTLADTLLARNKQLLQGKLDWQGRWNLDLHQVQDARLDFLLRYHRGQTDKRSLYMGFKASIVKNQNSNEQLTLGGETGLRGFPSRYQTGDSSALFTLEERIYTDHHPFNLVNVGYAFFVDIGKASFDRKAGRWLTNIGFGLRLMPSKSDKGNVIHLDIAYPINQNLEGVDSFQISAQLMKSF